MTLCTPEYLRELANNRSQRAQAGHRNGLRDAADEIERLRAQLERRDLTRKIDDLLAELRAEKAARAAVTSHDRGEK